MPKDFEGILTEIFAFRKKRGPKPSRLIARNNRTLASTSSAAGTVPSSSQSAQQSDAKAEQQQKTDSLVESIGESLRKPRKWERRQVNVMTMEGEFSVVMWAPSTDDDEPSGPEADPDPDYTSYVPNNSKKTPTGSAQDNSCVPGLDLSDPKQLAEFAKPGHKVKTKKEREIDVRNIGEWPQGQKNFFPQSRSK